MKRCLAGLFVLALAIPATAQPVYHGSARVIPMTGPNENEVFLFDSSGTLTGSYDQVPGAREDAWGYRDGATDGNNNVYFGWGGGVARHAADGSGGTQIIAGGAPAGVGTWRAMAFDPTGDSGNGSLWVASFSSDLIETSLTGTLLNAFPLDNWSLYGLAYDDSDGNLFGHDTAGDVIKIDTTTGSNLGIQWNTGFANLAAQGGLSGFDQLGGGLAAISQGVPDELGVYRNPGPAFSLGPVDIETQSGTNGHLGVAVTVIPEPAAMISLGLGVGILTLLRRRR